MTYKNGIKEYLLMIALYGVPMGILFGLSRSSLLVGVILGVLSGFLFTLLMFLFIKFQEKKFSKMRQELEKEKKIICDGGATINGNGGWMFLTENGIEFYPHKINISREEIKIPINMIDDVTTHRNQIIINTADKSTVAVVVSHNKEWKKQIEVTLVRHAQK